MKIWEKAAQTGRQAAELLDEQACRWVLGQLEKVENDGCLRNYFREDEFCPGCAQKVADGLAECMGDKSVLPLRPLHKAKCCYTYLMQWFKKLEDVLSQDGQHIEIDRECLPPDPLAEDISIELVKMLHKGVTKDEISKRFHLTQRAVQEKLAALNGSRKTPLRVGGQALHVNVSDMRIDPKNRTIEKKNVKEYHTWNTMHPVMLQLNMMQLWTLFRALALYQSKGYTLGDDIAKDIWVQLSEYGQEKLEELAADRLIEYAMRMDANVDLSYYLNNIQTAEDMDNRGFRTERDLLGSDDNAYREAYVMFYKAGRKCNVEFGKYPNNTVLEHQIIINYENGILSFREAEDENALIVKVPEDQISYIELCG